MAPHLLRLLKDCSRISFILLGLNNVLRQPRTRYVSGRWVAHARLAPLSNLLSSSAASPRRVIYLFKVVSIERSTKDTWGRHISPKTPLQASSMSSFQHIYRLNSRFIRIQFFCCCGDSVHDSWWHYGRFRVMT